MTWASTSLFASVLSFALLLLSAAPSLSAQEKAWEDDLKAGDKASRSFNFAKAEKEFLAALDQTQTFPPNDLRTAETLGMLANVYSMDQKFTDAENRWKQAIAILEASAAPDDPLLAYALIGLGLTLDSEYKSEEAAPVWARAIAVLKTGRKPLDPAALDSMKRTAGRISGWLEGYAAAEGHAGAVQIYQSMLELEESLGGSDRDLKDALRLLSNEYERMDRLADAEPLQSRILQMDEKNFGPESIATSVDVESLADIYTRERKYAAALPLWQRALEIAEKNNQPDSGMARTGKNMATALDATILVAQIPFIALSQGGVLIPGIDVRRPDKAEVFRAYRQLARGYANAGKYPEAEEMYKHIIEVDEKEAASKRQLEIRNRADDLKALGIIYRRDGRYDEALDALKRAAVIDDAIADSKFEKAHLSITGPSVEPWLTKIDLAETYREKGDLTSAETLFQQALEMAPNLKIVPGHPKLAELLDDYATLFQDEGKYDQAESLYKRSLDTWKLARKPPDNPEFAQTLTDYAALLRKLSRVSEAEPLETQAAGLRAKFPAVDPSR